MHKKNKLALAVTTALVLQTGYMNTAVAQESEVEKEEGLIERIEVRTRKMAETLETIPLAISAISSSEIKEKNIQSTQDVAKYINGLNFDVGASPNDIRPSIRGLSIERGRPNVAILIDGIDVSSESMTYAGGGMTANMKLLDIQQVEVVKGPQSVNYGRSAFAGAVNYVTRRPDFENNVSIDLTLAQDNTYDAAISVEGGLTDELAVRLKYVNASSDGQYSNPNTGGSLGGSDMDGFALSALWIPSDNFTAYFRAETSDENYDPRPVAFIGSMKPEFDPMTNFMGTGSLNTEDGAVMLPYTFDSEQNCELAAQMPYWDNFDFLGPQPNCRPLLKGNVSASASDIDLSADPRTGKDYKGTEVKNKRAALELEYEFEDMSFASNTSYTNSKSYVDEDFDQSDYSIYSSPAFPPFAPAFSQFGVQGDVDTGYKVEQYNQEFRLTGEVDSFTWVASALYWREKMHTKFGTQFWLREGADKQTILDMFAMSPYTSFITDIATEPASRDENPITNMSRKTEHWSVAGLLSWAINDEMNLSFEGRYMDEKIDYKGEADNRLNLTMFGIDNSVIYLPPTFEPTPNPNYNTTNGTDDTAFLPRATFDYQLNETVFTYATVSKGFKPGGVTTTGGGGDISTGEYKPEKLWAYELGAKAYSVENNALVNMAVFYWDYTDQQVPFTFADSNGIANVSVVNAGESSVKGVEIDGLWQITPELRLSVAYLYADAQFEDFNISKVLKDADLPESVSISDVDRAIAGNAEADFSNTDIPMSAKHTGTLNLRYTTEFSGYGVFAEIFGNLSSDRNVDRGGHSKLPAYAVWDFTTGVTGDDWKVDLFVNNLFDDRKIKSAIGNVDYGFLPDGQSVPYSVAATLPQKRTVGVRMSYKF